MTPLWKAFWLICLPVAALYQLLWAVVFQFCAGQDWFPGIAVSLVAAKLTGELMLYAVMLWYLSYRTATHRWESKALATTVLGALMVLTAAALARPLLES